jgi:hypothetical protein
MDDFSLFIPMNMQSMIAEEIKANKKSWKEDKGECEKIISSFCLLAEGKEVACVKSCCHFHSEFFFSFIIQ